VVGDVEACCLSLVQVVHECCRDGQCPGADGGFWKSISSTVRSGPATRPVIVARTPRLIASRSSADHAWIPRHRAASSRTVTSGGKDRDRFAVRVSGAAVGRTPSIRPAWTSPAASGHGASRRRWRRALRRAVACTMQTTSNGTTGASVIPAIASYDRHRVKCRRTRHIRSSSQQLAADHSPTRVTERLSGDDTSSTSSQTSAHRLMSPGQPSNGRL